VLRFTVKRVVSSSGRIGWGIQDHRIGRLTGIMLFRRDARMVRDKLNNREGCRLLEKYYKKNR